MAIRAVVFDIGGVLEITPRTGWGLRWETKLQLQSGDINTRLLEVWRAGSLGNISEAEVEKQVGAVLGLNRSEVELFMNDLWAEYLGELNAELTNYFANLRPRYQTAILSNSFVGARERESARYHFDQLCDMIIYSHEVGLAKPDPRIYALTCERLKVRPEEVVFLDDVEVCVNAAREFGIHGILFQNNAQAIAAIEACLGQL